MSELIQAIEEAQIIGISGHSRPDGDCVGSCLGLFHYIKESYPEKEVTIYLEPIKKEFQFLSCSDAIDHSLTDKKETDLFIVLDCADEERLGNYKCYLKRAKKVFCVDHHISNTGFGDFSLIESDASSTCEILYEQFDYDKINRDCAESLYMGIVHDTGVFKHTNTTRKTMYAAGDLIAKGLNTSHIIDDTFYRKTYVQNQILGRALVESIQLFQGKMIYSVISKSILKLYGVSGTDLDGIIDQLRMTEGVECAVLIYEIGQDKYKISLRSNDYVNVSEVASGFGGGGHIRAAGCMMTGTPQDIIEKLCEPIVLQMKEAHLIENEEMA